MEIEQNEGDHDYMSSFDIKTLVSPEVLSVFLWGSNGSVY